MNCDDFIDYCAQDECYTPNGGPYSKMRKFYLGDPYCRHLKAHYGHDVAVSADRYKDYEDDE